MGISSALGSSALLPAGLGFRNAIINGDFSINQRAFSSTTTEAYGHDRWRLVPNTGTVTYSTQTFTIGNEISGQEPTNFARIATSGQSAAGAYSILQQRIEFVRTFAGQQVTISFWAKASSGSPKVSVELEQVFGTTGSPSSPVFTNFGTVTLGTSWVRYSVTATVASISGKTLTTNDYIGLNLWTSAGTTYSSRTNSIGVQNSTIDFWGVQVEQNTQPTSFERRPYGVELALCQRYYEKQGTQSVSGDYLFVNCLYLASTTWYLNVPYKVTKRISATPTVYTSGTFIGIDRTFVDGFNAYWSSNGVMLGFSVNAEL